MCYLREGNVGLRGGAKMQRRWLQETILLQRPFIFRKEVWFFNLKLTDCLNEVADLISWHSRDGTGLSLPLVLSLHAKSAWIPFRIIFFWGQKWSGLSTSIPGLFCSELPDSAHLRIWLQVNQGGTFFIKYWCCDGTDGKIEAPQWAFDVPLSFKWL